MPVGRAADLVVTAGKEVRDLNERRQENLTTRAGTQEDYDFLTRIDLSSDEDDERVIFYKKGKAAGKLGPFELNTAADLFFYRGWRKGRGKKT